MRISGWSSDMCSADHYASTEPFLIAFFVLYVAIAVLFALRRAPTLKDYVDPTLVFGTPLVGFGLQTQLVAHYEIGRASCRERVCQYASVSLVAVSLTKNHTTIILQLKHYQPLC